MFGVGSSALGADAPAPIDRHALVSRHNPVLTKLDPSSQDGISAKMGIDATKPVSTEPMAFKRIHVKGVENVDLGRMLQRDPKAAFARMIAS